jgi:hypothetical protein
MKALKDGARRTAHFSNAYALPVAKPFRNVILASTIVIVATWAAAGLYLYLWEPADKTPVFNSSLAVMVVAVGWVVAGGITYRNTIRQNTYSVLFARFSQAHFGEALNRFLRKFGFDESPEVTQEQLDALRATNDDQEWQNAASVGFLLNYFELVASGVVKGDLHEGIVRENFRGAICFFHKKCWPIIEHANRTNHRTYSNLIRLNTFYDGLDEIRSRRRRNILLFLGFGAAALIGFAALRGTWG